MTMCYVMPSIWQMRPRCPYSSKTLHPISIPGVIPAWVRGRKTAQDHEPKHVLGPRTLGSEASKLYWRRRTKPSLCMVPVFLRMCMLESGGGAGKQSLSLKPPALVVRGASINGRMVVSPWHDLFLLIFSFFFLFLIF